ncbi:MAG: hypothetical protein Tsb0013_09630 [Phycisphaerales bacterium]
MNSITAFAGVLVIGTAAVAQTPITNTPAADVAALGVTTPLNLSGNGIGASGANFNQFVSTFADTVTGTIVNGTITSEVFANVAAPGTGLTDVVIKYTMTNTGLDFIDAFDFGVNGGQSLDAGDILRAQQGVLTNNTSAGVNDPAVSIDTLAANPLWKFDFPSGVIPDQLGPGETFSWYVKSDGDNALALVDVVVQNSVPAIGQAWAFVDASAGQPDLNVPAPGAVALAAFGAAFATRRRRA